MAYGLIQNTTLQSIADAIRLKNESSDTYKPGEMASAILDITTGEPDWTEIGYEDTPQSVLDAFDYAKDIQDNWVVDVHASQFANDKKLYFFPTGLNLMGTHSYANMFDKSNLMYIDPIELGYTSGSYGTVSFGYMFRETHIEEITITAVHDTYEGDSANSHHYYNNCFQDCKNLKTANINSKPSAGVPSMFYGCTSLTTVTGLDTSATQALNSMYYGCTSLVNPPLLDLSSATAIQQMHYGNTSLVTAPNYNTPNVTNMSEMFRNCTSLTTVPQYNTGNATNMSSMFNGCSALENVPIFNAAKVTNMNDMFSGCTSLTDTSRDNILQMCVGASVYTGTKTLARLGFNRNMYTAASWQALPSYNDFINAGWSIGYT